MKKSVQLYVFLIISLLYSLIVLLGPSDSATLQRYHMTQGKAHLLSLTVVIPFLIIWLIAYSGYAAFRRYSQVVQDSPEGPAFNQFSYGLMILTFGLPVNSLTDATLNYIIYHHASYTVPLTIIRNYSTLLITLVAFLSISLGAEGLSKIVKKKAASSTSPKPRIWPIAIIAVSSLFSWLIIARPIAGNKADAVYAMPNVYIIATLAIPYLYAWYRGALAVVYVMHYLKNVKGRLYREALRFIAAGITSVIAINVFVQLIITISPKLSRLHFTPIFTVIYLLIAMYAVAFGFIAKGANQLKKIEEV